MLLGTRFPTSHTLESLEFYLQSEFWRHIIETKSFGRLPKSRCVRESGELAVANVTLNVQSSQELSPADRRLLIDDACHYMQLAEAAYGWRGALVMGTQGSEENGATTTGALMHAFITGGDMASFAHRAGVDEDCMLYKSQESEINEPFHWLMVDHARNELVLCELLATLRQDAVCGLTAYINSLQHCAALLTWMILCSISPLVRVPFSKAMPMRAWLTQHTSCYPQHLTAADLT